MQRFIHVLSDHLSQCETRRSDYNTPWYKWIVERLQQFFLLVSSTTSIIILSDSLLYAVKLFSSLVV